MKDCSGAEWIERHTGKSICVSGRQFLSRFDKMSNAWDVCERSEWLKRCLMYEGLISTNQYLDYDPTGEEIKSALRCNPFNCDESDKVMQKRLLAIMPVNGEESEH